ncbi:MAG: Crp/Fnr family transcriptional regulator [Bacteroidaceae bacterium]|nr:Crp/Fnr family transcriptional regulator [Bacteroidaceae bacterium]
MELPMYDTLLSLPLFQGMSQVDFNSLLQKVRLDFVRYEEGSTIISAGERCKSFAFLINGSVESSRSGMDGNLIFMEQVDAPCLIEPYSMFGRAGSYQRTYTALTPCSFLMVDKQYIYTELGKYNICRMNLLNILSGRVQQLDSHMWTMEGMDLRGRITRFIKGLSDIQTGSKKLCVKMNDLATLMDATRLNVSRELNALEAEGLISLRRKEIFIPALEKLTT